MRSEPKETHANTQELGEILLLGLQLVDELNSLAQP